MDKRLEVLTNPWSVSVETPQENPRDTQARRAAIAYYLQNKTMEAICRQMGISRSTVSRLLSYARETGIVNISIRPSSRPSSKLARQLHEVFDVRAHLVDVPSDMTQSRLLEVVAKLGAQIIDQTVESGQTIGIAWGNTTSEVATHLQDKVCEDVTLVQLNGAASIATSGISHAGAILAQAAKHWNAHIVQFPVPAFFDRASTKEAMWEEGAVKRVLDWQSRCQTAIFGIGALRSDTPSHVYSAGYLSARELNSLEKQQVVGDVCTVLLRQDGSWQDIALNHRATGPNPDQLKQIPRRFAIVAGKAKASALLAALRAGVITDLICDREVASLAWDLATR